MEEKPLLVIFCYFFQYFKQKQSVVIKLSAQRKLNFQNITSTAMSCTLEPAYKPVELISGYSFLTDIKLTAKTVDEDPASCKRWISRKEI